MTGSSKAADTFVEIYKLIPPTAGIMLALIWGLANNAALPTHGVLVAIRFASVLLVISIITSFIGLAYTVDALHGNKDLYYHKTVNRMIIISWCSFVAGAMAVVTSIFLI